MTGGPIAVVGMGCRFPGSPHLAGYWETIRTGRVCARPIPAERWRHELFYSVNGAREFNRTYAQKIASLDDYKFFAPEFFGLTPRRAKVMDPQQRLFLDAARMALDDAGYANRPFPRERTGVFAGTTVSDFMDILTARQRSWQLLNGDFGRSPNLDAATHAAVTEDLAPMQAYSMVGSLINMVAANVNQCFDFGGPAFTTDAACSSALVAMHEAVWQLRAGLLDAAVVGGVYLALTPDNMVAFARIGALSSSDTCRPYDGRADGFVIGEGVGAVILRRLEDAQAAGDRIYAVIRGIAANSDGKAEGPMTPRREGQLIALERAYADAGLDARTVGFLEGHGTATPVGDATEIAAFRALVGKNPGECAVGSVKANIGHSMSAAGIAGFIKACLAVLHRSIPPQPSYDVPRPELELESAGLYVAREARSWDNPGSHPRRAGVNAFGFGGTNVHVVLEEPGERRRVRVAAAVPVRADGRQSTADRPEVRAEAIAAPDRPELIVLSAPNPVLLRQAAGALAAAVTALELGITLRDVAYTLALRRADTARLALVVRSFAELAEKLHTFATATDGQGPPGVHDAAAPRPGDERKIVFLFPGQGLQAPGLCQDLYRRFPAFRAELDRLAAAADGLLPRPLLSYLYPGDEVDAEAAADALTATEVCQPAVAAVALALARFARRLGVAPDLVLGHSLGEFAAAADAGLLADDAACVRFLAERGRLIAAHGGEGGDRGTMSAVAADAETVRAALQGIAGVVLANLNHPRQVVLSGTGPAVAEAEQRLAAAGARISRLRVSHAFHSPLMGAVATQLEPHVAALALAPANVPVVSAIRPGPYGDDPAEVRQVFVAHATSQVDFVAALGVCSARGARLFVQVGAGSALAAMASVTAAGSGDEKSPPVYLTLAGAAPDDGASLLGALAQLFVLGVPVAPSALHDGEAVQLASMLPPSLLDVRSLWPVVRRPAAEASAPVRPAASLRPRLDDDVSTKEPMDSKSPKPEAASVIPPAENPGAAPASDAGALATLFQHQMAVMDAHVAIIRQQNALLARGADGAPPVAAVFALAAAAAPAPAPSEILAPPVSPDGNGYGAPGLGAHANGGGNGRGNGSGPRARPKSNANGGAVNFRESHGAPAAPAAPAALGEPQSRQESAATGPSQADLEAKVIEVVARITAHPPARLKPSTKLGSDLGFDSLMVVELVSGLQEILPDADPLSRSIFNDDTTIADIAGHLGSSLAARGAVARRPSPRATRAEEIRRYTVSYESRGLPAAGLALPRAPVVLLADAHGIAEALRRRLERRNVVARVVADDPGELPAGATVVDLRAVGPSHGALPEAAAFRQTTLAAFELVRRLDGARPTTIVLVHRGLAATGVAGMAKALGREWPETRVLAVEIDAAAPEVAAEHLLDELAAGETAAEVRYFEDQRLVPVLRAAPLPTPVGSVSRGAVVAISGGGSGLGARLARALARSAGARLVLLGRRPRSAETERLLEDIRAAGGDGLYFSCDVRDPWAVAAAMAEGRQAFGSIELAVHAAGLVEDAPVARKDAAAFSRVFDTKVAGALAFWYALGEDPLATFLIYGSWAGRFGNAHQLDYAAANHVVGRLAEMLGPLRPGVRVVTLDLPPWEGSTMLAAVPEAVRAEMRSRGVSFLNDETGLARVMAELAASAEVSGEALLGARLPARTVPVAIRTRLSSQTHPYLDDHRIGDRPVLPMAAAVNLLLAAARGAGAGGQGGVTAVKDLAVVKGVILTEGAGEVVARASAEERGSEMGNAGVELLSLDRAGKASLAYRAKIGAVPGWLEPVELPSESVRAALHLSEFYGRHTFHGPRLRSVDEVVSVGAGHVEGIIRAGSGVTEDSLAWLLAVDGALQLCAYWAVVHHGRIGLPVAMGEMRLQAPIPAGARLVCRAALRRSDGDRFEGDLDLLTEDGEPLVQIRGLRAELWVGVESPEVDSASYRIEEFPEVKELQTKIDFARAAGVDIPYFRTLDACTGATALIDGREYLNFTSYNYVGLSGHPRIAEVVADAVRRYGTSVSASRVTGGQKPIHTELEHEIAQFLGTEDSIVMVGGHATNVSVIGHLLGPEDLVLHDALAHDSILGGARLAGARRRPFPHNDYETMEKILREVRSSVRRVLIAVEGVYSMDGDVTPLPQIIAVKKKYGALLFVDEAHSLGVLGETGRGVGEHYGVHRGDVEMWMGTMSKTLASCGGYIAGSAALIQYLKYTVPGFIYSVGMSPANAAAALTALRILVAEPERARTCQDRARFFLRSCQERGIDTGSGVESAVVPCIVGNSYACIRLAEGLLKRGIHVHPIIYPAVPESLARLRFFITAGHSEEQLRYTADALADELAKLSLLPGKAAGADSAAADLDLESAAPQAGGSEAS